MKIGIFIEPNGPLKENIINWKKKFNKINNRFKYINHPPHLSIFTKEIKKSEFNKINLNVILKNIASHSSKINLEFNKNIIFYNDELTNGNTLVISTKRNKELMKFQKLIAKELLIFSNINKNKIFKNSLFTESNDKYGNPFVGNHWSPHLTICSVNNNLYSDVINEFLDQKVQYKYIFNRFSLWIINEDNHTKINDFAIK